MASTLIKFAKATSQIGSTPAKVFTPAAVSLQNRGCKFSLTFNLCLDLYRYFIRLLVVFVAIFSAFNCLFETNLS